MGLHYYDGDPNDLDDFDVDDTGKQTDTSYKVFGEYDVALRVTDGNGKMNIAVLTVPGRSRQQPPRGKCR